MLFGLSKAFLRHKIPEKHYLGNKMLILDLNSYLITWMCFSTNVNEEITGREERGKEKEREALVGSLNLQILLL